ncbi:MAG: hypothetical protein AAGG01_21830 [Planctomycetota bacterium]
MDAPPHRPARLDLALRSVAEGSRRVAWVETFGRVALWTGGVAAVGVLLSRSVAGWDPLGAAGAPWGGGPVAGALALVGVALLIAAVAAALWTRRAGLDEAASALWLDLRAGSGGEVVTAKELGDAELGSGWSERAADLAASVEERPEAPWSPAGWCAAAGAAAILLTTLVPLRTQLGGSGGGLPAIFEERIEQLDEKLSSLDEEVGMEESEREAIEDALERLEASLEKDPDLEATYEALDSLEEQLGTRAEEALAEASQALSAIEEAAASDEGDDSGADAASGLTPEMSAPPETGALEDLLSELDLPGADADLANDMGAALELGLAGADLADLASLAEANLADLSPEELAALAEAMKAALNGPLESLSEAGLLEDPGKFSGRFKPATELKKLTEEQLAMLEACPDCGQKPSEEPGGT